MPFECFHIYQNKQANNRPRRMSKHLHQYYNVSIFNKQFHTKKAISGFQQCSTNVELYTIESHPIKITLSTFLNHPNSNQKPPSQPPLALTHNSFLKPDLGRISIHNIAIENLGTFKCQKSLKCRSEVTHRLNPTCKSVTI